MCMVIVAVVRERASHACARPLALHPDFVAKGLAYVWEGEIFTADSDLEVPSEWN